MIVAAYCELIGSKNCPTEAINKWKKYLRDINLGFRQSGAILQPGTVGDRRL